MSVSPSCAILRSAIDGDELDLHYQPKLKVREGRIGSAEALLRWNHSKHGLLRTDKLIDIAEQTGAVRETYRLGYRACAGGCRTVEERRPRASNFR